MSRAVLPALFQHPLLTWSSQTPRKALALPYLFHEELNSLAGHTVLATGHLPLLDDVPSLAGGIVLLLAQIL